MVCPGTSSARRSSLSPVASFLAHRVPSLFSGDVVLLTPLFQAIFNLAASQHSTVNLSITVLVFCTSPQACVDGGASSSLPSAAIKLSSSRSSPLVPAERLPIISFGRRPPLREILQGVTERSRGGGLSFVVVGRESLCVFLKGSGVIQTDLKLVLLCRSDALVSQMGDEVMLIDKATIKRVGGSSSVRRALFSSPTSLHLSVLWTSHSSADIADDPSRSRKAVLSSHLSACDAT